MKTKDDAHLSGDRLLMSMVEGGSLGAEEQRHLRGCPICSAERHRIERALDEMGRTAARLTPVMQKKIWLPPRAPAGFSFSSESRTAARGRRRWLVASGAVMVLLVLIAGAVSKRAEQRQLVALHQEISRDEEFLTDLIELEERCLPDLSIASSDELDPDEGSFLDFVIPVPTVDAAALMPAGGTRC